MIRAAVLACLNESEGTVKSPFFHIRKQVNRPRELTEQIDSAVTVGQIKVVSDSSIDKICRLNTLASGHRPGAAVQANKLLVYGREKVSYLKETGTLRELPQMWQHTI